MKKYIVITINNLNSEQLELITAILPEYGVDGMEEHQQSLIAYTEFSNTAIESIREYLSMAGYNFDIKLMDEQNWNTTWESNFEPVIIAGKIQVRAFFHPFQDGFEHNILITPKMSFGTGHHATTSMMMDAMLDINFANKRVIDFGTGTGILSILAVQRGAESVYAIDNDEWSILNVSENVQLNHVEEKIIISKADDLNELHECEILLANINKNVLIEHVASLHKRLISGGLLVISGLLVDDYEDIMTVFNPFFGLAVREMKKENWIAFVFAK
jgi:ribosomal protein L11 methyltransferase